MEDNTSEEVKKQRLYKLNERINYYANMNNQRYKDKVVDVLIEGPSEKDNKLLMGYTDTMKLVNIKGPKKYIGKIVKVKITDIKTWSLDGEIVSDRK